MEKAKELSNKRPQVSEICVQTDDVSIIEEGKLKQLQQELESKNKEISEYESKYNQLK